MPKNPAEKGEDAQQDWEDSDSKWMTQVSRLANPLVNEVIIGLPDKDGFNDSNPRNDAQFLKYVTNPTLPVPLNVLFWSAALVPGTPVRGGGAVGRYFCGCQSCAEFLES